LHDRLNQVCQVRSIQKRGSPVNSGRRSEEWIHPFQP
jgi:hypothetical protein